MSQNPGRLEHQRIGISGLGTVTGFGRGVDPLWQGAVSEKTCLANGLGRISESILENIRKDSRAPRDEFNNTALLISLAAIEEAMAQAGWSSLEPTDGIILATTTGQIPVWDRMLIESLNSSEGFSKFRSFAENQPLGALLEKIMTQLSFKGPSLLLTSACSASTQAIGVAAQWIQSGRVKRVLVGGTEVLCDLTIHGFSSLQLLSTERCKPFDESRSGINLSEGSAFLCLESENKSSLARISGFGMSQDAFHMTAPHPEGRGTIRAIQTALVSANLNIGDLSWVQAHGTGSAHNDLAEGLAYQQLCPNVPVSSTKSIHGHSLGAVGAIESILVVQSLREQKILRTAGLEKPDPKFKIRHVERGAKVPLRHVLKNTAGFGGSNAALVFSTRDGV